MASRRRHPVQALVFASTESPKLYAAIANTLYCISATTRETLAVWKAPAAPVQGKPPSQQLAATKLEDADAAEASPVDGTDVAAVEPTDAVMADSPPSAGSSVVGKRKRSPSASSTAPVPPSETEAAETETKKSATSLKNQKKRAKKRKDNEVAAAVVKPPPTNYIGHLLAIPSRNVIAVTTLEDKSLRLLNLDTLEVTKEWTLYKRPSDISIIDNESTILVGDKFGDVYTYNLPTEHNVEEGKEVSDGKTLLGHVSMLTTLTTATATSSPDATTQSDAKNRKKYVITADRDEHIRVTNYPLTYVIHRFCLGHTAFVSRLLVTADNLLISGGGDDWLGVWDWENGKLVQRVELRNIVEGIFEGDKVKEVVESIRRNVRRRKVREEEEQEERIDIAISQIAEVEVTGRQKGREIIVVLESAPVILRFRYTTAGNLEYASHVSTAGPIVSLAVHGSKVYFSCDGNETGSLLTHVELAEESPLIADFLDGKEFDGLQVEESEIDGMLEHLYIVESLRKEFGGMVDDE
ncbi:hypothetical protein ABW20_dc0106844 [Dactylellina cionopaga]|nr:hypothetical protein ABW20_dc0106844 [Dactylellina cionopaga]